MVKIMSNSVFVAGVLALILVGLIPDSKCRSGRVKRIVNGEFVDIDTQPRVASLRLASTMKHLCGGTLLSRHCAVTAAHCVSMDKPYVLVLNNSRDRPVAQVLDITIHHQYDKYTRAHDIAFLRLNTSTITDAAWLDKNIIPRSSFGLSGECTTYGYGSSAFECSRTTDQLYSARLRIVSLDECTERLGQYMVPQPDAGMMCATGIAGADTCQGDSGAPVLCDGLLEGISSHGMSCGVPDLPAVYTSIGCHKVWIEDLMQTKLSTGEKEICHPLSMH